MNYTFRMMVDATRTRLYRAEKPSRIQFWIPKNISFDQQDQEASVVFFAFNEDECTIEEGTPLLYDDKITLDLLPGEEIWLVTSNLAYAGATVVTDEAPEQ